MYEPIDDPDVYPGTSVLRNRLDLQDQDALSAFEVDAVTQRGDEPFPDGPLGPLLYQAYHRHLFQDVYAWAGTLRRVRIHRDQSTFCYPQNIAGQLDRLFAWLAGENHLENLDAAAFAAKGAHFLSELNVIHAFREGNGRTQMSFFAMLAERAGHRLDFDRLDPDAFLAAMIAAFHGPEEGLARQIFDMIE